ncbi:MAG TPA: orotidine-5'-phosphate decarboxylase [Candidatus Acidoferrales bacterium]|nr:orotidine-5'-phosphate decarboxylase [Candidatus Acidoferrales bacterium]
MACFGDRVIERMRRLGHPLCVGLDPYLDRLPPPFRRGAMVPQQPDTAQAVEEFCCRTIDLIAMDVAIVKPQVALFERLGWYGWRVLERVIRYARAADLLVLLDAKRGDIAETATAYAQAYLAPDAPCSVDAMTVNPYLGPESLEPFLVEAEQAERGVIVLVRNSNPDSSVYQAVATPAGPFFTVVAASLAQWQERLARGTTGWSSLGVTVAATHAEDTERIRVALPHALFLVLGYGAQGASAREAVRGFCRGPAGLEGGIVSSSRPILFPAASSDAGARAWEQGVRSALVRATTELGEAVV